MTDVKLIGNDDNGGTTVLTANYVVMQRFQAVSAGQLAYIKIKCGNSVNAIVGLYADSGGNPAALLATSSPKACITGWNTLTITYSIASGTYYWLAINTDAAQLLCKNSSGLTLLFKSLPFANGIPNPAGTGYTTYSTLDLQVSGWAVGASGGLIGDGLVGESPLIWRGVE